jgi:hypothetical protein
VVLELAIVVASCGAFGAPPEGLKAKRTRKRINKGPFTSTRVKRAARTYEGLVKLRTEFYTARKISKYELVKLYI